MENQQSESILVKIFGKDYSFKATGNEDNIRQAASQVDQKMREIGGKSPNLSTSDVAILAAMYIFDEYSSSTVGESSFKGRIESRIESLIERIDQAV